MTVRGKGGAPRKWRTNAERTRAWRARKAGLPEPPAITQNVDEDELARRLHEIDDLTEALRAERAQVHALTADLNRARRRVDRLEHQVDNLMNANSEAHREIQSLRRTIDWRSESVASTDRELFDQPAESGRETRAKSAPAATNATAAPGPAGYESAKQILDQWAGRAERTGAPEGGLNRAQRRRQQRQNQRP